jgi:hypothetical protein
MENPTNVQSLIEVKRMAAQLQGNWILHQGRRFVFVAVEIGLYIAAIALLAIDVFVISKGHRLLLSEAKEGTMRASAYVEDERVTALLMVGYLLLLFLALGCFVVARLMRSSRVRRSQMHRLCEAIRRL